MKRKIFSAVLAFVMLLTLAPVALAQGEGPYVANFSITVDGVPYSTAESENGIMIVPGDKTITGLTFTVTFNEAVDFVVSPELTETDGIYNPGPDVPRGAMYVSSVEGNSVFLNLNIVTGTINFNDEDFHLEMTTTDHIMWSGSTQALEYLGGNLFTVAHNLYNPVVIPAGSAVSQATGEPSLINNIILNTDNFNVYMREGGPGVEIVNVTYECNGETYVWKTPKGSTITFPEAPTFETLRFDGWYLNEQHTESVPANYPVTGDMTVYALYTPTTEDNFAKDLADQKKLVVTINNEQDFRTFASQASIVEAGRRVVLGTSLDFSGYEAAEKTFTAISYKGNFDGGGNTITGAIFAPSGDNAGMFAEIGQGQIIANLNLDNITVQYAQNAGVLAGSISANSGDTPTASRPLIQNVQVTNSTVSGRNAGGLVGFTFITIIKFCSVSDTTVDGLVNAGGIAAQSYSAVSNCYTKNTTPDTFLYDGGIVATMLEASSVTSCWTTYGNIYARNPSGTEEKCFSNAAEVFSDEVPEGYFDPEYWNTGDTLSDYTFTDAIYYQFTAE